MYVNAYSTSRSIFVVQVIMRGRPWPRSSSHRWVASCGITTPSTGCGRRSTPSKLTTYNNTAGVLACSNTLLDASVTSIFVANDVTNAIFRPSGRLDLAVDAPLRPSVWMLQAVSMSPRHGIAFNEEPYVVGTQHWLPSVVGTLQYYLTLYM